MNLYEVTLHGSESVYLLAARSPAYGLFRDFRCGLRRVTVPHDLEGTDTDGKLLSRRGGIPELEIVAEDMLAEGDQVVLRRKFHGLPRGPFAGIEATGNLSVPA